MFLKRVFSILRLNRSSTHRPYSLNIKKKSLLSFHWRSSSEIVLIYKQTILTEWKKMFGLVSLHTSSFVFALFLSHGLDGTAKNNLGFIQLHCLCFYLHIDIVGDHFVTVSLWYVTFFHLIGWSQKTKRLTPNVSLTLSLFEIKRWQKHQLTFGV